MSEYVVVMTTVSEVEAAEKLARQIIESELVACVNVLPATRSFYKYNGRFHDEQECLLLMKTRSERYADLENTLNKVHPYDVPEILALPVLKGSASYLAWVDGNVGEATSASTKQ